ncbi:hypothetical protein KTU01_18130 [Kocuria turfanensis]|uniref:Uncharacterized protein n=1 Tax=Kocuria turfanensis TaxID=388357 RepID=A0A512IDB7_9MICC|nr:hypothetical protein KTU01_18130 [Kocuria turfanensis]
MTDCPDRPLRVGPAPTRKAAVTCTVARTVQQHPDDRGGPAPAEPPERPRTVCATASSLHSIRIGNS